MERRCADARNSSKYKEVARSKTGGRLLMLSHAMGHAAIPEVHSLADFAKPPFPT